MAASEIPCILAYPLSTSRSHFVGALMGAGGNEARRQLSDACQCLGTMPYSKLLPFQTKRKMLETGRLPRRGSRDRRVKGRVLLQRKGAREFCSLMQVAGFPKQGPCSTSQHFAGSEAGLGCRLPYCQGPHFFPPWWPAVASGEVWHLNINRVSPASSFQETDMWQCCALCVNRAVYI